MLVLVVDVGQLVRELIRFGVRPKGHESQNVLGVAGDLRGFGAVDRIEVGVAPQAMRVARRKDGPEPAREIRRKPILAEKLRRPTHFTLPLGDRPA